MHQPVSYTFCRAACARLRMQPAFMQAAFMAGVATLAAGGPTMQRLAPRLAAALRPPALPAYVRLPAQAGAAAAVSFASPQVLHGLSLFPVVRSWRRELELPDPVLPMLSQHNMHTLALPLLRLRSMDWWFEQSLRRIDAGAQYRQHLLAAPPHLAAGRPLFPHKT